MFGLQMFNEMERLQRDMEQLFAGRGQWEPARSQRQFGPFKVREAGEAFVVEAPLPGLDSENLEINVLDRKLSLKGTFREMDVPEDATWHRRERPAGAFERVFTLPVAIDADKVVAEYRQGVLTVNLPKAESALPKKIAVKTA